jgi:hypothetical protein
MTLSDVRPAPAPAPPSKRSVVPWLVILGLFAVTAAYILVAVPRTGARPGPTTRPMPTSLADGLADTYDGYTMAPVTLPTARGTGLPVAFRILGPDGAPAAGYTPVQTVPLHLYVVREDLSHYQHLHPRLDGDTWRTAVDVPDGGVYRMYAEFTPPERAGNLHPHLLSVRFIITGDTSHEPVPVAEPAVDVGPFTVDRMDGTADLAAGRATALRFQIRDARGDPVAALEPYLGAFAHVSSFDVLTMAMTHLHPIVAPNAGPPADGVLTFHTNWSAYGEQRLFLQFQVAGRLYLAPFTVVVV